MSGFGFNPFGLQKSFGFEAGEDGVERAFRDIKLGFFRKRAQDFEAVKARGPETGEDGHFEAAFAQLGFPVLAAISIAVGLQHTL